MQCNILNPCLQNFKFRRPACRSALALPYQNTPSFHNTKSVPKDSCHIIMRSDCRYPRTLKAQSSLLSSCACRPLIVPLRRKGPCPMPVAQPLAAVYSQIARCDSNRTAGPLQVCCLTGAASVSKSTRQLNSEKRSHAQRIGEISRTEVMTDLKIIASPQSVASCSRHAALRMCQAINK